MKKQPFLLPGILFAILFSFLTILQLTSLFAADFVVVRMLGILFLSMIVLFPVIYCFILWKSKGGRIAWRICLMVEALFLLIVAVADLLMFVQSAVNSYMSLHSQNDIFHASISLKDIFQLFSVLLMSAVFFLTAIMNKKPCKKTCMISNGLTVACFVCLMISVISITSLADDLSFGTVILILFLCLLFFSPIFVGIILINCGEYRLYEQSNQRRNHGW